MTFDYIERNGLLYPNIVIKDADRIEALGKYGKLRLEYLHSQKSQMYRELLITGKLADHCERIETLALQLSEQIHHFYISQHSLPEDDFWTRVSAYSTAQMIADEVVCHKIIYV